jgi:hypothetical protein
MTDKPLIKTAARPGGRRRTAIVVAFAMGCGMFASLASAQSITDRFKSLFGGGKSEAPAE